MRHQIGLITGTLSAIGASLCCIAPLVLVSLGIGGSWISQLTQLEPLRPYLITLTLLMLALAGYQLYFRNNHCDADKSCANPSVKRRQRVIFWLVTTIIVLLLTSPWLIAWLFT